MVYLGFSGSGKNWYVAIGAETVANVILDRPSIYPRVK
jgi:hypothetical protein